MQRHSCHVSIDMIIVDYLIPFNTLRRFTNISPLPRKWGKEKKTENAQNS